MTRKVNALGIALIKQWEGLRLTAYQCSANTWTIGWGHTRGVRPGQKITVAQAEAYFQEDLADAAEVVDRLVRVPLTDNQFATLASFVFNLGETKFAKSTLLRQLNKGNYAAVPFELMKWVYSGGKKTEGLANRRAAECGLWARGNFVSSGTVPTEGKPTKPNSPEVAGTIATATAGAGGIIASAQEQLMPFAMSSNTIMYIVLGLIVAGAAIALFYSYKRSLKESAYE